MLKDDGLMLVDSAQCFNTTYSNTQSGCIIYSFNNATVCPCLPLKAHASLGPHCQVLGRTFHENGGEYAVFDGRSFSNLPSAGFSLDSAIRPPNDDFFWMAIEIHQSTIRFHFPDQILDRSRTTLNASTCYDLEYLYNGSNVVVSINDQQYLATINDTLYINVQLYLGDLPTTDSSTSALYPSLTKRNGFNGSMRNVLANGYYVDMHSALTIANSHSGSRSCALIQSC